MDDPKARDSRPGRARTELPESLAWLYDAPATPPADAHARRDDGGGDGPGVRHPAPLPDGDPERLPTLLPFSAPPPLPEPEPEPEPEPDPEPEPAPEPPAIQAPASWPDPEPVRPPTFWRVPEPEPVEEPEAVEEPAPVEEPEAVEEPAAAAPPAPLDTGEDTGEDTREDAGEFSLFEPVPRAVPPAPPSRPLPLPSWHRFAPEPEPIAFDEPGPRHEPHPDLPDLADPALGPLWAAVRDVLQAPVRHTDPVVDVRGLDQAGRRALAVLLGVPAVRAATRIGLHELEDVVRAASGLDLATAADRFVPMFVPARRARTQSRTAPVRAGQEWLEEHTAMAARPWTATWLETVRRDVVGGESGLTEYEVTSALEILAVLTESGDPARGQWRVRAELAADVVGDEQALDEGSAAAALVVRGLAAAAGWPPPADAAARRRLWARFGVVPDLVSTTCLTLGVAPVDRAHAARWEAAAHDGAPVHVTPGDLRRAPGAWRPAVTGWDALLVVDSARVLEALAERFPGRVAAVCTDGVPGPLVLDVLARLHEGGTPLRFVTDFDGPGLALGALLAERFGAQAWRMSAADYRAAARSDLPPVTGRVTPPEWAPELAAAMTQIGRAVPAEQVLGEILESLAQELPVPDEPDDPDDASGNAAGPPAEVAVAEPADEEELVTSGHGGAISG